MAKTQTPQRDDEDFYKPDSVKKADEGEFGSIINANIPPEERQAMQKRAADGAAKDIKESGDGYYQGDRGGDENSKLKKATADEKAKLPEVKKGRWAKMSKTKKRIYTGAGGSVIGLVIFFLPILSGPLQFLNIANIAQKAFSSIDAVSDSRVDNVLRRMRYFNQPERGRLGIIGNRVADNIETRLKTDGIEVIKNNAGFMEAIRVNGETISIADIDNPSNSARRKAFRAALRDAGYGRVATALMSRPINYRYGIDFKPLGNIKRGANETFTDFALRRKQNENERIKEGTFKLAGVESLSPAEQAELAELQEKLAAATTDAEKAAIQAEIDALLADGSAPVGEFADVQEAYEQKLAETGDPALAKAEASKTLSARAKVAGVGFITSAVMLGVCFTQQIGDAAVELEYANMYLPEWRHGMNAMAIGSQIQNGGNEVDFEELSVLSERFVEEYSADLNPTVAAFASIFGQTTSGAIEQDTSWDAADTVAYQDRGVTEGYPASNNLLPGSTAESNFVQAASFFDFAEGFCDFMSNPIVEGITIVLEIGLSLFGGAGVILRAVGGVALELAFEIFVLSAAGQAILARIVGDEVPAMIAGQSYGHAAMIGSIIGSNEASRVRGAFSLTKEDSGYLQEYIAEIEREDRSRESFMARMFDFNDPDSLVGSALLNEAGSSGTDLLAAVLNPTSLFNNSVGTIANLSTGQAYAQDEALPLVYDFMPQISYSVQEIEDEAIQDPFENEVYLLDKYGTEATLEAKFGECFDPLPAIGEDVDIDYQIAIFKCDEVTNAGFKEDLLRYRIYLLDIATLESLGCYGGDGQSCNDLGLGFNFEPDVNGEDAVAAIWSDTAIENVNIAAREARGEGDVCSILNADNCSVPTNGFVAEISNSVFGIFTKATTKELIR